MEEDDYDEDEHLCVICRDDMKQCVRLACTHEFHVECLQDWISRSKDCPLCRTTIDLNSLVNENNNNNNNQHNHTHNTTNNTNTTTTENKENKRNKINIENSEDEVINEWDIDEN